MYYPEITVDNTTTKISIEDFILQQDTNKITDLQIKGSSKFPIDLPESISRLTNLKEIWIQYCRMIPNSFWNLKHVQVLELTKNKEISLPEEISNLINLTNLVVENCQFIPDNIDRLSRLQMVAFPKTKASLNMDVFVDMRRVLVINIHSAPNTIMSPLMLTKYNESRTRGVWFRNSEDADESYLNPIV